MVPGASVAGMEPLWNQPGGYGDRTQRIAPTSSPRCAASVWADVDAGRMLPDLCSAFLRKLVPTGRRKPPRCHSLPSAGNGALNRGPREFRPRQAFLNQEGEHGISQRPPGLLGQHDGGPPGAVGIFARRQVHRGAADGLPPDLHALDQQADTGDWQIEFDEGEQRLANPHYAPGLACM